MVVLKYIGLLDVECICNICDNWVKEKGKECKECVYKIVEIDISKLV